jgi:cystathionine gamma-lyase
MLQPEMDTRIAWRTTIPRPETLISLPALMTHASTPWEVRAALGITDRLVRVSIGIEDCDDLIADLEAALG